MPAAGIVIMLLLFLVFILFFYRQFSGMSDEVKDSDIEMLKNALNNAAVTCYAIEGSYPESLEYIEEHYGITVDREKYIVEYQIFLPNVMPEITVYAIKTGR